MLAASRRSSARVSLLAPAEWASAAQLSSESVALEDRRDLRRPASLRWMTPLAAALSSRF